MCKNKESYLGWQFILLVQDVGKNRRNGGLDRVVMRWQQCLEFVTRETN